MQKVLSEHGRSASRYRYAPSRVRVIDGEVVSLSREPMQLRYRTGYGRAAKESYLSFKPLHRFLASRIGQPWDEVHSELRGLKGARSEEAIAHAVGDVAVNTFIDIDGVVKVTTPYYGVQIAADWYDFYVHPTSRCLHGGTPRQSGRKSWAERAAEEVAARRRDIDASTQAHLVDGIWYAVKLAPLAPLVRYSHLTPLPFARRGRVYATTSIADPKVFCDAVLGQADDYHRGNLERLYGRKDVYGISRRQLGHKELVKLGLAAA
ncbi:MULTISPECIES: hypothetical protein [unclassified Variovorax]|uniref:hypothetical protein n=1 Tax=unclassified Variovorax TaxID=663243 RepID=UPI0013A59CD9|nr:MULTISPECIES: hypothetical protein [unclassified Variovorax]